MHNSKPYGCAFRPSPEDAGSSARFWDGKYPTLELNWFKIKIDDALSGFDPVEDSFEFKLDNQPLIYAFQPKTKEISYELDRPLPIGTHKIQFKAKDRAGNEVSQNIEFTVY